MHFVFDTNTLISAALFEQSVSGRALQHALLIGKILWSSDTLKELHEVLSRPKFERYVTTAEREAFLVTFVRRGTLVEVTEFMQICRDPKDNMMLELAVSGQATCIVTGDLDLRVLNPFRGIAILTPAEFLVAYAG